MMICLGDVLHARKQSHLQLCGDWGLVQVAGDAKRRSSVLPYAVQLAAASSVESPFVHLDSLQVVGPYPCYITSHHILLLLKSGAVMPIVALIQRAPVTSTSFMAACEAVHCS